MFVSSWKLTKSCPNLSEKPERQRRGTGAPGAHSTAQSNCSESEGDAGLQGSAEKRFPRKRPLQRTFASRRRFNQALASHPPLPATAPHLLSFQESGSPKCACARRGKLTRHGVEINNNQTCLVAEPSYFPSRTTAAQEGICPKFAKK